MVIGEQISGIISQPLYYRLSIIASLNSKLKQHSTCIISYVIGNKLYVKEDNCAIELRQVWAEQVPAPLTEFMRANITGT